MSAKKSSPFVAVRAAALLALLASTNPVFGQAGPAPTPAPANGAPAPAANGATPPAPGARRGGRGPSIPLSDADKAEIAKADTFPAWTPGAPDGNYFVGPNYKPAPEQTPKDGVPKGKVVSFTFNEAESKFYPDTGKASWRATRHVTVYIPSQYVPGTPAPFIVSADEYGARGNQLPNVLDTMIAAHRVPVMIAVMIANGGGDGGGSERGLEYDTVASKNAEFIEAEILPKVEKDYGVTLTKDPDGRMSYGGSSGGSAAFTMAWFHPELYHRVLTYSGTYVNQQAGPDAPHGAWDYHATLIPQSPAKPLRVWLEAGQNDNGATAGSSGFHNWLIANLRMAEVLKAKGYHYQLIYAKGAGHTDGKAIAQTLPGALEWVWQDYKPVTH